MIDSSEKTTRIYQSLITNKDDVIIILSDYIYEFVQRNNDNIVIHYEGIEKQYNLGQGSVRECLKEAATLAGFDVIKMGVERAMLNRRNQSEFVSGGSYNFG